MSAQVPDLYAVLGVPADATFEEIQTAFLELSVSEFEDAPKLMLITAAYLVLNEEESRLKYDNLLRAHTKTQPQHQNCRFHTTLFFVRDLLITYVMYRLLELIFPSVI